MSRRMTHVPALLAPAPAEPPTAVRHGATTGRVIAVEPDGVAVVDFPGSEAGPVPARRIGVIDEQWLRAAVRSGAPVVLVFENGDPRLPLLLSVPDPAPPPQAPPPEPVDSSEAAEELRIDGRRLVLQGTERIELRCGDASIVLRADGTLKIRGRDVTTLARRRQRIKGGTVAIN